MSDANIAYMPEKPGHDPIIEAINAEAFGPGRFARAAYKIREGGLHDTALSFVAVCEDDVVGSVRQTWVAADLSKALLLGPLAVRPAWKNRGIGRKLVAIAVEAARSAAAPMVILVGDAPYYQPLGFEPMPQGKIVMPRPVDPARLLVAELEKGSVGPLSGELVHADRSCVA
ncbi:MAG: GNAT family N-acetyltransferase [Rhizobiaceae bacterium]